LKITFLLTQSLESPSGLGRCWPVAKELARLGHDVTILALHHDLKSLKQRFIIRNGIKIYYVGQMHVLKKDNSKFYFSTPRLIWITALATWNLMKYAIQIPTDVYHIWKPHPMNGLAGLLAKALRRKKVFLDCDDYEAFSNRFVRRWQQQVIAWFEDHLPKLVVGITTNTRFMLKRLENLGCSPDRIVYVPNGVDRDRFSNINEAEVKVLRERFNLYDRKVILYVGTMSLTNHPVDLLIEAFRLVRQTAKKALLMLVGGGEDYDLLRLKVASLGFSSHILFVGRVPAVQVPLYYRLADVSVDPVYDDLVARARCPLKIVESLAAGVPVVTGDVGDRYELLGGGCAGKLVKPGDAYALASGILEIIENPSLALQLRQAAESIGAQYYWDVLVKDFIRVYELVR
jgi:glycosyltransferase involved in cell wall biosynthesis